ncbi:predicted protein [Nematostella vectensis]|uniref:Apple domain-containing protein n=1 Tax=Nematostella vectensis TaxID=45351 RepID=A7SSU6_NEMVE|nr:predicted protein [Nematostella vectensis]|eukprot:XP_001625301.1 predicted protein [Nematostella vectensis]
MVGNYSIKVAWVECFLETKKGRRSLLFSEKNPEQPAYSQETCSHCTSSRENKVNPHLVRHPQKSKKYHKFSKENLGVAYAPNATPNKNKVTHKNTEETNMADFHKKCFAVFCIFAGLLSLGIAQGGFSYVSFKKDPLKRLAIANATQHLVKRLGECTKKCILATKCVSFNFENKPSTGLADIICELLNTDKYFSSTLLKDDASFDYFYPQEKEGYGPKVIDVIAERVNDACSKKPLEQKLKELQNKYKTPENCKFICVPKVNVELWHDLERNTKSRDLGLQELQKNVVKAAQPIVMLFDSIAGRAVDPKDILPMLADSITLLGHAPYLCSLKRRELLKPDIAQAYQAVCSKSNPVTTFLFGDELPKHVKDIGKVNKIARRTLARHHIKNWRKITSDPWVLETASGYHLEFSESTLQNELPKPPPFGEDEEKLIDEEITKLNSRGAIIKVSPCTGEFISNTFLVPKKTGDMRPVINLKPLNSFLQKIHFKMENINVALDAIAKGSLWCQLI